MSHEMRRKDRQITKEEAEEILKNGIYGVLTTVGEDGYPYGVPVNYVCDGVAVYFHCAKGCGRKLENLNFSPKAGFTVVGASEVLADKFAMKYESVVITGRVSEVTEGREKIFKQLLIKYSGDYMEAGKKYMQAAGDSAGVYGLTIEEISGKARRS